MSTVRRNPAISTDEANYLPQAMRNHYSKEMHQCESSLDESLIKKKV